MNTNVKERTINWLETSQTDGDFDGFYEEKANFKNMDDDEIEWYFVEWFFTSDFVDDLDGDFIGYEEELAERTRILGIK